MIIRRQQTEVFSQRSLSSFGKRMAGHLKRCFPMECEGLGENGIRSDIRYGIERAAGYGFTLERDVCKYFGLMFTCGRHFDQDPALLWASRILTDEKLTNSTVRMERLYNTAKSQVTTSVKADLDNAEKDAVQTFWYERVGNAVQACSSDPPPIIVSSEKTHWIEIALMDEDGTPVSGESYRVKLPNSRVLTGNLDSRGVARIEGIDPGTCQVTFPDLDQDAWNPL